MNAVIIVPCFNESERLSVSKFTDYISQNKHIHFLFVDDGSEDNTSIVISEIISNFSTQASMIKNEINKGKAESVRLGVINSFNMKTDLIGYIDADLSTPLEEINRMINILKLDHKKKIVFASRIQLLGNEIKRSYIRHFIGRLFASCVSFFLKLGIYDTQCGAKIFSKEICKEIFKEKFISPWLFDVEIFARLIKTFGENETIKFSFEKPVSKWSDIGESKVKFFYFFKAPFELFKIIRHYKLR